MNEPRGPRTARARVAAALVVVGLAAILTADTNPSPERAANDLAPARLKPSNSTRPALRHAPVDPQDTDARLAARMRRDAVNRPALQHLPFAAEAITINLVGTDRDGHPVLEVHYATTLRAARAAYRRWLAYWRDHPSAYIGRFRITARYLDD